MSDPLKMALEEMKKQEEMANSMCTCRSCLSFKAFGKEDDYGASCFPTKGKRKNLAEHGFICGIYLTYAKMSFITAYYYTHEVEMKQKIALAAASLSGLSVQNHLRR